MMKIKMLIAAFAMLIGGLFVFNIAARHALAVCIPDPTGESICPEPSPAPDSTVSSSAPGPNTAKLNPPNCTDGSPAMDWPCGQKFAGDVQPYFDIGNDTAYKYPTADIPIYLRDNDIIDITISNASPDCQNTDSNTGLNEPDYNGNGTTGGPATTFSMQNQFGTFQRPVTQGSTASCTNTVTFSGVHWWRGDTLVVGGQKVDTNGVSNSGYDHVVYLHVSVQCPNMTPGQDCNATVEGENSFRVQVTNSNPSGDSQVASGSKFTGYGYRQGNLSYGQHFTQEIVFGVDETCTNYQQNRSGSISYADMDATNSNWNANIQMTLQRESWVNGNADGWTSWTNVPNGYLNNAYLQSHENGTVPVGSFDNTFRYRLLVQVVGLRNTIFLNVDGGISQISGKYHLTGNDCSTFVCTATAIDATDVKVSVTNKGPFPFGKGFELRQSPDPGNGPLPTGGWAGNFTVGGTSSVTFTRPANAIENYTLYDGTGASADVVGKKPLCKASNNNIQADCDLTTVTAATGQSGYSGQIKISWLDSGGNDVGDYVLPMKATTQLTSTESWDTFNTFPALWPHNAYTAELFVGTTSGWPSTPNDTDPLPLCLHGACPPTPSPVTGEVGYTKNVNYDFPLTNSTNKTFNAGSPGYYVTITLQGGLVFPDGSKSEDLPITVKSSGTNDVALQFNVIANYDGSFSVQLDFNNGSATSPISLDSWSGQCSAPALAYTWPYFQVWNGDVSTGGGFGNTTPAINGVGTCDGNYPYTSGTDGSTGGITAFGRANQGYVGSQVDFGAMAMGLIPGNPNGEEGFSSGSPWPQTTYPSLKPVFSNTYSGYGSSNMGGYLNGNAAAQAQCVKDYYDDMQEAGITSVSDGSAFQSDINNNGICPIGGSCQLSHSGDMTISGASLPTGSVSGNANVGNQVTLFVDGNLTIDGNITYPPIFNPTAPNYIPYLTVIVKGNITLTNNVTQLDGFYIAQPTGKANTNGIFATCNNYSDSQSSDPSVSTSPCNNQLVVNGAVISERLELLRSHGTLDVPYKDSSYNNVSANPAEIFNYVPSMVMGTPAIPGQWGQAGSTFTLPPVF